jgi:hypothetical protein
MNISPHILPHKNDPLNQYIWMKVLDINAKNIYIEAYYCAPINSTFYKKKNLDKNCPYKNLKQYIYNLRNEGSILLLGHFNARIATNQSILLINDSNSNPLWLDEDLVFTNRYKRNSERPD